MSNYDASPSILVPDFDVRVITATLFAGVGARLVPSDPSRFAIVIGSISSTTYFISPRPMTAPNQGVLIQTAGIPVTWNFPNHGALVTYELYGFSATGGTMSFILISYRPIR